MYSIRQIYIRNAQSISNWDWDNFVSSVGCRAEEQQHLTCHLMGFQWKLRRSRWWSNNTNMEKINLTSDLQCIERNEELKTFVNFISIQFTAAPLSALSWCMAAARTGNRTLGPWPRPRPHPRPGEPWAGRLKTRRHCSLLYLMVKGLTKL